MLAPHLVELVGVGLLQSAEVVCQPVRLSLGSTQRNATHAGNARG